MTVIVKKRQRRLDGIDEIVLSLTARGLTTGKVAAHFDEVYGAKVSPATRSRGSPRKAGVSVWRDGRSVVWAVSQPFDRPVSRRPGPR